MTILVHQKLYVIVLQPAIVELIDRRQPAIVVLKIIKIFCFSGSSFSYIQALVNKHSTQIVEQIILKNVIKYSSRLGYLRAWLRTRTWDYHETDSDSIESRTRHWTFRMYVRGSQQSSIWLPTQKTKS